jgi:hypothetical protein
MRAELIPEGAFVRDIARSGILLLRRQESYLEASSSLLQAPYTQDTLIDGASVCYQLQARGAPFSPPLNR